MPPNAREDGPDCVFSRRIWVRFLFDNKIRVTVTHRGLSLPWVLAKPKTTLYSTANLTSAAECPQLANHQKKGNSGNETFFWGGVFPRSMESSVLRALSPRFPDLITDPLPSTSSTGVGSPHDRDSQHADVPVTERPRITNTGNGGCRRTPYPVPCLLLPCLSAITPTVPLPTCTLHQLVLQ